MNEVVLIASYQNMDVLPTVYRFTVPEQFEREDIIEMFDAGLQEARASGEDGLAMYAADYVCKNTGGTVEYIEPDQEFGIE